MKPKKLKRDGTYGSPIDGYSTPSANLKRQFLQDARALLREVGKHLTACGLTEMEVSVNPAGPAVTGDVSALYWQPDNPTRRVYANISGSAVGWGRKDSLILLARVQFYHADKQRIRNGKVTWPLRMGQSGPNQWLSANFDSREIADRLWQIFQPNTSPARMIAFTSGEEQVIPAALVTNEEEATAWAVGMQATARAFAADNEDTLAEKPAPAPHALGLFNEIDDCSDAAMGV